MPPQLQFHCITSFSRIQENFSFSGVRPLHSIRRRSPPFFGSGVRGFGGSRILPAFSGQGSTPQTVPLHPGRSRLTAERPAGPDPVRNSGLFRFLSDRARKRSANLRTSVALMAYSAWRSAGEQTTTALIPGSFRMTSAQHIRRHCQFIQIYRKAGGCAACRFRRQLAWNPELLACAALFLRRACRRNCQAPKSSERDMGRRREFCRKVIILTLISRIQTFRIWTAAFRRRGGICGRLLRTDSSRTWPWGTSPISASDAVRPIQWAFPPTAALRRTEALRDAVCLPRKNFRGGGRRILYVLTLTGVRVR